jgi:hypothetical protein
MIAEPDESNDFLAGHIADLFRSFHELTGGHLIDPAEDAGRLAYHAPFVLLSHDGADVPLLTYGNLAAQELFAMDWGKLVGTPSRETAESPERAEREELLRRVAENGFIDDYSGIRIAADGRRFTIRNATVWNVTAANGKRIGQAATFSQWEPLISPERPA